MTASNSSILPIVLHALIAIQLILNILLLSCTVVRVATAAASTATISDHAVDEHQHYLEDDYDGQTSQLTVNELMASGDNGQDLPSIIVQPSILAFGDLPVGDVVTDVVTIFNKHANQSIYLGAISGNVPEFYISFFKKKVIPPMGNTTFTVVFIPRHQGAYQTILQIHTSFGNINYTLKGKGFKCMFRLNPLVGLRAPFNATLTPEILMYNPYSTPLQIVEVYSSGGQFQLELPSGGPEGPQALWEIPPYSTKPVIRVRFKATTPGNHTAYVRIKVSSENNLELDDVVLMVPIEIEIFNQHGVYSDIPFLNFGLGGTTDKPKKMIFKLLNSAVAGLTEPFDIKSYLVDGDTSEISSAISLKFNTEMVNNQPYHFVTATVDWSKIQSDRSRFKGRIVIKTLVKNSEFTHKIPFVGEVIKGSINYNESLTKFVTTAKLTKSSKDFILKNNFQMALAVTNITLPDDTSKYFKASGFLPRTLEPGDEAILFKITQLAAAAKKPTKRFILLHTNVSVYEIPVLSYNGLLRRIVPVDENTVNGQGIDEKVLNYGTLSLSTVTDAVLAFVNDSPMPIVIHNWTATISDAASLFVILRGCGNLTMDHLKFCYSIQPKEWVLFQVSVLSNAVGSFIGKLSVRTDYEELITPVKFSTAIGSVDFAAMLLDARQCFPGGLCNVNLLAYSTFPQLMSVKEILVNVTGIEYDFSNRDFPTIQPNNHTHIGQLQFNPQSICGPECYIEFPDPIPPSVISANCINKVHDLVHTKVEEYRAMQSSFKAIIFRVETSQVRRYEFNASINILWPKLVSVKAGSAFEFTECEAEVEQFNSLTLTNPTDQTIKFYLMFHNFNQTGPVVLFPPEMLAACYNCFLNGESVFSFVNESVTGHHFQYIPPRANITVQLRFLAKRPGVYSNMLYIRNNLTMFEGIWIQGVAKQPPFRLGNRKPGVNDWPLQFDFNEKFLKNCDRINQNLETKPLWVTLKRTFTARNHGDQPIDVYGMYIDGLRCVGFGYHIFDCFNFRLPPNGAKRIEIAYTPDFTQTHISKYLIFDTSLNIPINFTLVSTVPSQTLGACAKALRRPDWEHFIHLMAFTMLVISLFLVLLVSFFNADKVLKDHVLNMSKDKGPIQPTLDLRQIGIKGSYLEDVKLTSTARPFTTVAPSPNSLYINGTTNDFSLRKKHSEKLTDSPDDIDKKSWATVLVRKFSPIKTDVKFRPVTPPPPSTKVLEHKRISNHQHKQRHSKRSKKNGSSGGGKTAAESNNKSNIEDDSSSTATENSTNSSTQSIDVVYKKKPKAKSVNKFLNSEIKTKKTVVKKTKSTPTVTSETKESEPIAAAPKTSPPLPKTNHKPLNGTRPSQLQTEVTIESKRSPPASTNEVPQFSRDSYTTPEHNNTSTLKSFNKKYGKTPGRERSKKTDINRRNPASTFSNNPSTTTYTKQKDPVSYKGTAFQFTSPLTNTPAPTEMLPTVTTSSPIWDVKKISFSNIVAQSPLPAETLSSPSSNSSSSIKSPLSSTKYKSYYQKDKKTAKSLFKNADERATAKNSVNTKGGLQFKDISSGDDRKVGAMDLGPIGTRKSPSNTPLWESLSLIQKPTASFNGDELNESSGSNSLIGNPNSFFSGAFPKYSTNVSGDGEVGVSDLDDETNDVDLLGGASGLLENVYGDQNNLNPSYMWLNFVNQRKQHQQQQLLNQPLQTIYSNSNSLWGASFAQPEQAWTQVPIRPPPGLAPLIRDRNQSTTSVSPISSSTSSPSLATANNHAHQQPQPEQQPHNLNANETTALLLPQFDPFNALSSIWSTDNWPPTSSTTTTTTTPPTGTTNNLNNLDQNK